MINTDNVCVVSVLQMYYHIMKHIRMMSLKP